VILALQLTLPGATLSASRENEEESAR
jgi:hypothetical protein